MIIIIITLDLTLVINDHSYLSSYVSILGQAWPPTSRTPAVQELVSQAGSATLGLGAV